MISSCVYEAVTSYKHNGVLLSISSAFLSFIALSLIRFILICDK